MSIDDIIEIYKIKANAFYVWLRKFKKNHNYSDLENRHGGGLSRAINPYWEKKILKMILNPATKYEFEDGKRGLSVDTALRFSKFFGNSVEFWMGIQDEYEIREEKAKISKELDKIKFYKELIPA
jgi:hypothetical protein